MNSNEPESPDIDCDAPPYPIVRACRGLGFQSPEDVRWCHVPAIPRRPVTADTGFTAQVWKVLFGKATDKGPTCTCGRELPRLDSYTFTLLSGKEVRYLLGQCGLCQRIYWKDE